MKRTSELHPTSRLPTAFYDPHQTAYYSPSCVSWAITAPCIIDSAYSNPSNPSIAFLSTTTCVRSEPAYIPDASRSAKSRRCTADRRHWPWWVCTLAHKQV